MLNSRVAATMLPLHSASSRPRCHHAVHPTFRRADLVRDGEIVDAVFLCTRPQCERLLLARYGKTSDRSGSRDVYRLGRLDPMEPREASFPDCVAEVSPTFVEIFNQAFAAEAAALDQIFGMALRKALEFLVRDFAKSENPQDADEIDNTRFSASASTTTSTTPALLRVRSEQHGSATMRRTMSGAGKTRTWPI